MKAIISAFILTAEAILLLSGAAKIISAFGDAHILKSFDPIFEISFGNIMLIAGLLELGLVFGCLFTHKIKIKVSLVAWISLNLLLYRVGLWLIGWRRPCSCMGNLTDALHVSPQAADMIMKIILTYLLIGSCASLFWLWRQRKKTFFRLRSRNEVSC